MPSVISLTLQGAAPLGVNPSVKASKITTVNNIISAPVYKKKEITDNYNELTITFKDNYSLIFRAYNDGVAYRWVFNRPGEVVVSNEDARFNFDANYAAYIPYANSGANNVYQCSFENHIQAFQHQPNGRQTHLYTHSD